MSAVVTPARAACLTLDLEPDCGGRVDSLDSLARIGVVVDLFRDLALPLTVFVTGRIFHERPEAVHALAALPAIEFGVHAYSHRLGAGDQRDEIRRGIDAYRAFFGREPRGYRAPQGRIRGEDLTTLRDEGIAYDASIFPTFRPGVFNHLDAPNAPYVHRDCGLLEIPVTALRPLPIPLGLGYLRLLGPTVANAALRTARLPDTVVLGFHLHDIVETAHVDRLPLPWRWLYRRHVTRGADLLRAAVAFLHARGFRFTLMDEVARSIVR